MSRIAERDWVAGQYRDASNFDARVQIYRYAQQPVRWPIWLFERVALANGERVLEVGCGTGNLWRDNAARLPAVDLVLTDLSSGMLDATRERLADLSPARRYARCDAQSLPFADAHFDVAVANHMLYHVPDRLRALSELARVLRRGGRLLASTNDWTHLIELRELCGRFDLQGQLLPPGRRADFFDVETAADELAAHFPSVRLHRRTDALEVEDADSLVAYVSSMTDAAARPDALARLRAHAKTQITRLGSLHITISIALFDARSSS
jgi:SAM-dependent methyltransferase